MELISHNFLLHICEIVDVKNIYIKVIAFFSEKVSQTRLEARTHRPDVELCRDQPFHGLVHEVGQINESVSLLNMKVIIIINHFINDPFENASKINHIYAFFVYA